MIVVDTNVISYFYLHSEHAALAEKVFQEDPVWVAPLLWRSEFRSVLSLYLRKKIIDLDDALDIFGLAAELLKTNEYEVNSFKVLKISSESGCSAYDSEFVSLAQDPDCTLVTEDKRVLDCFPGTAHSMGRFLGVD